MTSNYNEIHISAKQTKYEIGDIFYAPDVPYSCKIARFDGLIIRRIGYNFGIMLYFDWDDWYNNIPKLPKRKKLISTSIFMNY